MSKAEKKVVARLTLVIEYEDYPSETNLDELVDLARGDGIVVQADYETLNPVKKSLV